MQNSDKWYLIQCKKGQEERALLNLANQKFHCYKPSIRIEKITKGKIIEKKEPLFPGYLFIQLNKLQSNWSVIRSTRGVLKLVAFGREPLPVDSELIKQLKKREDIPPLKPAINKGDRIKIENGPFAQVNAIFDELDGEKRAIVLLNLMNTWQRVKIPLEQLSA
ncbi:MAG: transcription/translation regulatory transformer protein RfaH [Gammaproteobacteria bacterium]|nr:MAG: transcription/translation regulatory transformer protein RfaH [Gammaproteobacteria bacterium]